MSEPEGLRVETAQAGVAHVVLDRPPVNALDLPLIDALGATATRLGSDPGVRVVLVESAIPDVFMVGADLGMVDAHWDRLEMVSARLRATLSAWERLPRPTIAALSGHTLGGGLELALCCDFRVMARGRGRIGLPEVQRGLIPAAGGTQRLGRLLGRARALDLIMRGRVVDADEAERIGLVTAACESDEVSERVATLAAELAGLAPLTLAAIKEVVLDGLDRALQPGLDLEIAALLRIAATEDAREGVRSFLEGRPPRFTGR